MTDRSTSLSAAVALMVILTAPASFANLPPVDDKKDEESDDKKGGNAADKTTEVRTERPMTGPGSLPPEAYALLGEFWGSMLVGDYASAAWTFADSAEPQEEEADFSYLLAPADGPAESVLDQLDESQTPLPMVGEPGSEVAVAAEAPTPPPESILDFIDTAPAPQPAVSTAQDAAKPAVDQAPKPALVQAPPP